MLCCWIIDGSKSKKFVKFIKRISSLPLATKNFQISLPSFYFQKIQTFDKLIKDLLVLLRKLNISNTPKSSTALYRLWSRPLCFSKLGMISRTDCYALLLRTFKVMYQIIFLFTPCLISNLSLVPLPPFSTWNYTSSHISYADKAPLF